MLTKLDICNRALTRCGAEPIATLTDNNKRALLVVAQYEATLREILNDTTWNFATKRVELSLDGSPLYKFKSVYSIPTEVIRVLEINSEEPFRIEGKELLTNTVSETLASRCIVYIDDPSKYSPGFVKAFYLKLAEDMAYSLVQSATLQQSIIAEAERYLRRARSYNSQEGTPESRYPEQDTLGTRL
jgi:hypothetical protein